MWPLVWPGTKITSAVASPSFTRSPSWIRSVMPGMRWLSGAKPTMRQPVASWIARLPPTWSPWLCVFRICVMRQCRWRAASSTGAATAGSMTAVAPLAGSCAR